MLARSVAAVGMALTASPVQSSKLGALRRRHAVGKARQQTVERSLDVDRLTADPLERLLERRSIEGLLAQRRFGVLACTPQGLEARHELAPLLA